MKNAESWIWLGAESENNQTTKYSGFDRDCDGNFAVCEFTKKYSFHTCIKKAHLRFSADTYFELYVNGRLHATGPCTDGKDYGDKTCPQAYYSFETHMELSGNDIEFYALVRKSPVLMCEYSKGRGGFMLTARLTLEDGKTLDVSTDESWYARKNNAYIYAKLQRGAGSFDVAEKYDGRLLPGEYENARCIPDIWHTQTAPTFVRSEELIHPQNNETTILGPGEEKTLELWLDKIYAGFIHASVKTNDFVELNVLCMETSEPSSRYELVLTSHNDYRSLCLTSAGKIVVSCKNHSRQKSEVTVNFISTFYPTGNLCLPHTSDEALNDIMEVCRHTLKICRQNQHLDSPKHCEPLCCTGDYYVQALMTTFSFGDMSLCEFDILRTASIIRQNKGKMFHTSFSLIWVKMMEEVYMRSGNINILKSCRDALVMLLDRFDSYVGENGILETAPDYMFVDWINVDAYSLHHPPKALGQSALNMFYYTALGSASFIFNELGERAQSEICLKKMQTLRHFVNKLLFDEEKGIYFEGLGTPTPKNLIGVFLPENTQKRYYLKHSNILAVYSGICEKKYEKDIIKKIMEDKIEGDYQPYFAHYLLEAIFKAGLCKEYTLKVIRKWEQSTKECNKGLVEGFIAPDKSYAFDHSHAWGGTPLYSLPKALLGFKITKCGLKEISLTPSLLGLEYAKIDIPVRGGIIECSLKKGEAPKITASPGVDTKIVLNSTNF